MGRRGALAGRLPRRYASIEDAFERMQAENPHLTPEQARHLTVHGVNQNEDGTYSWKFDNYVRTWPPDDISPARSSSCGRDRLPDPAGLRQGELGLRPGRGRAAAHFQQRGSSRSRMPATGCTTTGWRPSSITVGEFIK